MRAYVFWHYRAPRVEPGLYEDCLRGFHQALQNFPPRGFLRSWSHRIEGASWLQVPIAYEDWYEIDGSAALEPLEEGAVATAVQPAHEEVARLAGGGTAGLYRLLRPGSAPGIGSQVLWLQKPAGMPYPEFRPQLEGAAPEGGAIWQRQMVLGPAPEFCIALPSSAVRLELPASWSPLAVIRSRVWPAP